MNTLEYALGGIPMDTGASDTSILPTCSATSTALTYSFHRAKSAAREFSTIIEATSTFAESDWTMPANENIQIESIDPLMELVTATIPLAPGPSRLFVQLRVEPKP